MPTITPGIGTAQSYRTVSAPAVAPVLPRVSARQGPAPPEEEDKLKASTQSRSLEQEYNTKKDQLEQTRSREEQKVESEYRQERRKLEQEYKQKKRDMGISVYV